MKVLLTLVVGVLFLGLSTFNQTAKADGFDFNLPGRFEIQAGASVGTSILQPEWRTITTNLVAKIRNEHTPFGLSTSLNHHGWLGELTIDIAHGARWRVPVSLGYFRYFGSKYLSNQDTPRSWDLALGIGAEVAVGKWTGMASWKVFLPNPEMIKQLGYLYRPLIEGAEKQGQLWLGLCRRW